MIARELVSGLIPVITGTDTGSSVLAWMELYRVTHLPVVDGTEYLGLVSESEILEMQEQDQPLKGRLGQLEMIYIVESQHIYEAIEEFSSHQLTLLPVLSSDKQYLGCITLPDLVRRFSLLVSSDQPGAILVLTMAAVEYSLANLSRIIEENNSKVLSLYVQQVPDSAEISVTIKVNTAEILSITRSFERYGYSVSAFFLENESMEDFYRTRYEELMNYMNI